MKLPDHDFFTTKEVARMFRVSTMTIHRMIRRDELRVVRFGDLKGAAMRIPRDEVLRLVGDPPTDADPEGRR